MKKLYCSMLYALCSMLLLSGCAGWGNVRSTVTMPSGQVYEVSCKSDALVEFHDEEAKIKVIVDNRGRPGMIEQALGIMFMNLPDVEIKND